MSDIVQPPQGVAEFLFSTNDAHIFEAETGSFVTPKLYYWQPANAEVGYKPYGGFLTVEACLKHYHEYMGTIDNVIYVDFKAKKRV